jgi:hypothetical protein
MVSLVARIRHRRPTTAFVPLEGHPSRHLIRFAELDVLDVNAVLKSPLRSRTFQKIQAVGGAG